MQNHLLMRIAQSIANFEKQHDPLSYGKTVKIAPADYAFTLYPRHCEPRKAFAVDAAVDQSADVRVREFGENLSFSKESRGQGLRNEFGPDALQRYYLSVMAVITPSAIHPAHAAFADSCFEEPWTQSRADD